MPTALPLDARPRAQTRANAAARARRGRTPALTICLDAQGREASPLLRCLAAAPAHLPVDILALCGAASTDLAAAIALRLERVALPARLILTAAPRAPAAARNLLCTRARGRYILFLDADLAPDRPDFLENWLAFAGREAPAAAWGGIEFPLAPDARADALHWSLARHDLPGCANLLVRQDVAAEIRFDETLPLLAAEPDWLLRVEARYGVARLHNPALRHAFLPADRYLGHLAAQEAALECLRERHPVAMRRRTGLGHRRPAVRWPVRPRWLHALFGALAVDPSGLAPLALRRFAARAYRAACAVEAAA